MYVCHENDGLLSIHVTNNDSTTHYLDVKVYRGGTLVFHKIINLKPKDTVHLGNVARPTYYTSIGILILVAACLLDVFLRYSVAVYIAGWIALFLAFYDMFRFHRFRSSSSGSDHNER